MNNKIFNTTTLKNGLLCFIIPAIFSCNKPGNTVLPLKDTTVVSVPKTIEFPKTSYNPSGLDTTKLFNNVPVVNALARQDLLEVSGVAASRSNPGILYIHQDSGDPNQIYLTDGNGNNNGTLTLTS